MRMIDVEAATAEDSHRPSGTAAAKSPAWASELPPTWSAAEATALHARIINALLQFVAAHPTE